MSGTELSRVTAAVRTMNHRQRMALAALLQAERDRADAKVAEMTKVAGIAMLLAALSLGAAAVAWMGA